jgi:hypothetical protein
MAAGMSELEGIELERIKASRSPHGLRNLPPRHPVRMPAGSLVAWTAALIFSAAIAWLMTETQLRLPPSRR